MPVVDRIVETGAVNHNRLTTGAKPSSCLCLRSGRRTQFCYFTVGGVFTTNDEPAREELAAVIAKSIFLFIHRSSEENDASNPSSKSRST
jgi:hypothetical protein